MNSQENNLKIDDGKRKKLLAAVSGPDVFIFRGTEDNLNLLWAESDLRSAIIKSNK